MEDEHSKHRLGLLLTILVFLGLYYGSVLINKPIEEPPRVIVELNTPITVIENQVEEVSEEIIPIHHQGVPGDIHAIYISGWSAGSKKSIDRIFSLFDRSNINAVVIDIKDATGRLSYMPLDPELQESGVGTNRISDLPGLLQRLHDKGIYVIGRVTVFQDPYFALKHPGEAFKDTRTNGLWNDNKRITWLRPDSLAVWQYTRAISIDAHVQGFDEINLDYVRYPSDGPLVYLDPKANADTRVQTMESFFKYMDTELRGVGIVVSADLFGLVMTSGGDIGIGQKLTVIAPYVDYVAPMIYPSHFASGSYGYESPSNHPYEIIYKSMADGIKKLEAVGIPKEKLRPWLQDFDLLGVRYTPEMVSAQIQAVGDVGLGSWMMWDPKNTYQGLVP